MLKSYRKAMAPFSTGGKAELALLNTVQVGDKEHLKTTIC